MKKKIDYLTINPDLINWLFRKLHEEKSPAGGSEFIQALQELNDGSSSALMIELGEEAVYNGLPEDKISCGELVIIPGSRKVLKNNVEIWLTPKEYDILLFLLRNKGEVFTKEQIYRAVWVSEYLMDDSNIMAFIRKLRKKIEPNPDAPEYIITIWGIGYKFNDKL